jgi:anti-sigma regulatory factor (Ser/Thr protein kinase)
MNRVPQLQPSSVTAPAAPALHLRVLSDTGYLAPVRHSIESFCIARGFDVESAGEVGLCVNEAMANISRHAYGGAKDRPVEVAAEFDGASVTIRLRDWGIGREPPAEPKHDPLTPGGVGMVCLKKMLDGLAFTKMPDGMLLTMKRTLTHGKAP